MKNKIKYYTSDGFTTEDIVVNKKEESVTITYGVGYTLSYKGKLAGSLVNNQNGLSIQMNAGSESPDLLSEINLDYSQADYLYKLLKAYRKYLGGK